MTYLSYNADLKETRNSGERGARVPRARRFNVTGSRFNSQFNDRSALSLEDVRAQVTVWQVIRCVHPGTGIGPFDDV